MLNEKKIKQNFGKTLKFFRLQKGLSQEGLAELSQLHRTYISEVERGDRNISLINIYKLCTSLDIKVNVFFALMQEAEDNEGEH